MGAHQRSIRNCSFEHEKQQLPTEVSPWWYCRQDRDHGRVRCVLKRCAERHVPFFTHQVDAKKPTRIVLLGLDDMLANEIQVALAERGIIPDDIKPMNNVQKICWSTIITSSTLRRAL
jgi:hypothetical protein